MNRYFTIYHGLHERAPWGVAVERVTGSPKTELLMLCRTEKDAGTAANLVSLGHSVESIRDQKLSEREAPAVGGQ